MNTISHRHAAAYQHNRLHSARRQESTLIPLPRGIYQRAVRRIAEGLIHSGQALKKYSLST